MPSPSDGLYCEHDTLAGLPPARRACDYCRAEHDHCDLCGHRTAEIVCPFCGWHACEIQAMEVGDMREAQGLPRKPEGPR